MTNLRNLALVAAFVTVATACTKTAAEQKAETDQLNLIHYNLAKKNASTLGGFENAKEAYHVPPGFDPKSVHLPQVKKTKTISIDGSGY